MPEIKQGLDKLPVDRKTLAKLPASARVAVPMADPDLAPKKTSLLGEFGLGAGMLALGGLITKSKFAPRLARKGLVALGLHASRRTGAKMGHSLLGGLAGAAVVTPTSYLGAKAMEMSEKDKKFDPAHFGAIAAPAVASGLLSYGMYSNISQSIAAADKTGAKGMVKNIFSPKRNIRYAKHGFKLAGKAFGHVDTKGLSRVKKGFNLSRLKRAKQLAGTQWKGRAGGLLALGILGMEAIAPAMYLNQTRNNKKENGNGRV